MSTAGVRRLVDLSVYAPALTSHSGNLITPHRTSAEERDAATLLKPLAPFSLSPVTHSCSLFITFLIFFFPCWFHNNYGG